MRFLADHGLVSFDLGVWEDGRPFLRMAGRNGNTQQGIVWDVENRLVTSAVNVTPPGGTQTSQTTNYTYDPWGRRMWKEIPGGRDANNNPLPSTGEIYFYGKPPFI